MTCRVLGHGSGAAGDELNSPSSFERLCSMGCDGVELDVRRTGDGGLAVIHDAALPDGRAVAETRSADLPSGVLLLADALDRLRGLWVNIEIKNHPTDPDWDAAQRLAGDVVTLLGDRNDRDRVIVSSFGAACLAEVRNLKSELLTAQLLLSRRPASELLDRVVADGHRVVHPYDTMVDEAFMDAARARGLTVHAWTAEDDSRSRLLQLVRLGVDGLITGAPALAMEVASGREG